MPDWYVTWKETELRSTWIEADDLASAKAFARAAVLDVGEAGEYVETVSSTEIVIEDQDGHLHDA